MVLNIYRLFFTKRTFFEQEREVRLLYSVCDIENHIKGIPLYVNLKKLILSIVVSPTSDDYLLPLVIDKAKVLGLETNVMKSSI